MCFNDSVICIVMLNLILENYIFQMYAENEEVNSSEEKGEPMNKTSSGVITKQEFIKKHPYRRKNILM